jgi:hypothetical protein
MDAQGRNPGLGTHTAKSRLPGLAVHTAPARAKGAAAQGFMQNAGTLGQRPCFKKFQVSGPPDAFTPHFDPLYGSIAHRPKAP